MMWLLFLALASPPAQAAPDPGARAFQRCAACHSMQAHDPRSSAPSLKGIFGRRAAAVEGFAYSDAMKAAGRRGLVWDEAALERYLTDPEAVIPGTTMPFQGGSAAERAAVIAWLRQGR